MTSLTFTDSFTVRLDRDTLQWVDVKRFAFDGEPSDAVLLSLLLLAPAYNDNYAGDLPPKRPSCPGVHVNWWLDRIDGSMFTRIDPSDAVEVLRSWAEDDWADGTVQSEESRRLLRDRVLDLFHDHCSVYRFQPPSDDAALHDELGSVGSIGIFGFHEFVIIEGEYRQLRLVVAADD